MARLVMEQLVAYGEVSRGRLGLHAQDLTPQLAEAMDIDRDEGAIITRVGAGSPAAKAGLQAGDVVIAVDGAAVRSSADLRNKIGLARVGTTIELTVARDGEVETVRAEIADPRRLELRGKRAQRRLSGASFARLSEDSPLFGRVEGVQVTRIERGSPAWRLGLRKDDVVVAVNRTPVSNLDQFMAAARKSTGALVLKIQRGNAQVFIVAR